MTMSQNSVLAIAAVFALLAVGGIAGYAMSQHDPSDSSEGTGGSGTNDKMQGYATDLSAYPSEIRNAPVIRGSEGMRAVPPRNRSKVFQDYKTFFPHP